MLVPTTATDPTPIEVELTEEEILADLLYPAPLPAPAGERGEDRIR